MNGSMAVVSSHHQGNQNQQKAVFSCDIPGCDKKFGRNCELTRHKLNHMDIWPFLCDYPNCGRKFKRKDVYKNHQRTHIKEDNQLMMNDSNGSSSFNHHFDKQRMNQILSRNVHQDMDIQDRPLELSLKSR